MSDPPRHEKWVTTTDGLQLWTQVVGDRQDPPLLLIMGANASALGWPDEFVDLLVSHGLSVIRYDHRDTGRSTHRDIAEHPYSLDDMARDAVAVLDGHGIEAAHVVGLSLGGTLGQLLALDHRHRLRSLTVMLTAGIDVDFAASLRRSGSGESTADELPAPSARIVEALARRADPVADRETALQRRVAEWRLLAGEPDSFDAEEFRRWEARAIEHSGSFQQPTAHGLATPVPVSRGRELAGVTTRTLVIQGQLDPINPPPHGQHLAGLIPGARCVQIAGMGHALPSAVHHSVAVAITDHIGVP